MRGTITGANGEVLAMTVATYLVYADPPVIPAAQLAQVAAKLAGYLGLPAATILSLIQNPTSPQYVVLAKGVSAQVGDEITAANLPGISLTASYARSYPNGDSTADVLGFTSSDSQGNLTGAAGIEQEYNSAAGRASRARSRCRWARTASRSRSRGSNNQPVTNGSNLRLTIVPALQYAAEQACAAEVAKTNASNCTVVIIQPKTGYVLAMAQWPTYDPTTVTNVNQATDLAVQNEFQPGSTAKVIAASAAFEKGGQTPMSAYTIPYQIVRGGQAIHDAEWARARGTPSPASSRTPPTSASSRSSRTSAPGPVRLPAGLRPRPAQRPRAAGGDGGELPPVSQWWPDTRYTLAFGQGVAATAIQMAEVYATIANNGVRIEPTLVEGTTSATGKYTPAPAARKTRVIQPQTASELRQILEQVPAIDQAGDQPWGIIPGYAVAAKTGTSQESNGTCALCVYGSSYIGMAPGNDPQLVIAVNVQNPRKGGYYGDEAAARSSIR